MGRRKDKGRKKKKKGEITHLKVRKPLINRLLTKND